MSPNPESTNPAANDPESGVESATPTTAAETPVSGDAAGIEVQTPEFQEFSAQEGTGAQNEIGRFHDIHVTVSAELGRTSIPIQKLLSLGSGSVLELDRSINSPIELIAQGVPLASGEVVVVDDCFAIRITEVYPTK